MLTHLTVRNLAVVEFAEVDFGSGLNIITGETGAGKSVLIGAISLLLGGRADRSAVREGAKDASAEAVFSLSGEPLKGIAAILEELGLPACEDGTLLIRRSISTNGTGRCFVNDVSVSATTLRRIGSLLADVHGPYDNQSLLNPEFQRSFLDAYGQCSQQLNAWTKQWHLLQGLRKQLNELQGTDGDTSVEIDRLQFVVDEISSAALTEADGDDLVRRHAQAANAEFILQQGQCAMDSLCEGELSAFNLLASVQQQLTELARILPEAAEWRTEAQNAAVQVQELSRAISETLSAMDADPEVLQKLDDRLSLVQKLKRKYGATIPAIQETLAKAQARLDALSGRSEKIEQLNNEISSAEKELLDIGANLTRKRAAAAGKLSRAITAELRGLGFLKSGFDISLSAIAPSPSGMDAVEFGFAPNPGEPIRPLKSIASSGETARIALAAKAVLAAHDSTPLLVFDEIDANIGGEVGKAVGEKLRRVAKNHQVLSITHLPQSAVWGEKHFVVAKHVEKGRTRTEIREVDGEERVAEIVRMLGGDGESGVVKKHAMELLSTASKELS